MKDLVEDRVLRFTLDENGERGVTERVKALGLAETAPQSRTLRAITYDTADFRLRSAGILLRLRRDGRTWTQSAQTRDPASDAPDTAQADVPVPGEALDLAAFPDAGLGDRIEAAKGDQPLAPVAESVMRRSSYLLHPTQETDVHLSIDTGEIRAAAQSAPLREAQLRLVRGNAADLYDLATELLPEGGATLCPLSQAERGYRLAGGAEAPAAEAAPRTARAVRLDPAQTSESAARDILVECFAQIEANVAVVGGSDDPEGPHQLRIGLRRLRTALSLFRPILGCPALEHLNAEARWLGQQVGALRDLDVALTEIVDPEAEARDGDPGFKALQEALAARRTTRRAALRADLQGRRVQALLVDLARFIETRPWLAPSDYTQTARLALPLRDLARQRLDKRWRKVCALGKHIETLPVPERHELRKELKKLRYGIEFFRSVYSAKRVKGFVKTVKELQELFGALNDLAMAEELFTGPDAPCADIPEAQRAVGRILGVRTLRSEEDWHRAQGLWRNVRDAGPFWR